MVGARVTGSYEIRTRDRAAQEAIESGAFADDVRDVPGVAAVYFGCPDVFSCATQQAPRQPSAAAERNGRNQVARYSAGGAVAGLA